jgi:hypothetical protein
MTMTMETGQVPEGADLTAMFRRLFGETPEPEEYEYVRVPGLHLASELEDVIEPGTDYVIWQAGQLHNGRMLLAVYCRHEKMPSDESSPTAPAPAPTPAPPAATGTTKPTRTHARKRSR